MKRSDMLRILWESINEVENAETLLDRIEAAGMLPPHTDWFVNNKPDEMHWSEIHDYYQWEPEDDGDDK